MTILDFNLMLSGPRTEALDERDRIISILKEKGYTLIMMDDSTRVLMERAKTPRPKLACPCECNRGGFCGGCGHAGCGRR